MHAFTSIQMAIQMAHEDFAWAKRRRSMICVIKIYTETYRELFHIIEPFNALNNVAHAQSTQWSSGFAMLTAYPQDTKCRSDASGRYSP